MTKTAEFTSYAHMCVEGDRIHRNGVTRTIARVAPVDNGVWFYYTDGESAWFLRYDTVTVRPLTTAL
jgi:hypothetical protein